MMGRSRLLILQGNKMLTHGKCKIETVLNIVLEQEQDYDQNQFSQTQPIPSQDQTPLISHTRNSSIDLLNLAIP